MHQVRILSYQQVLALRLLGVAMLVGSFVMFSAFVCGLRMIYGRLVRRNANMSATYRVSDLSHVSGPSIGNNLMTRLRERIRRLFNPTSPLFQFGEAVEELLVARHGPVEIRRTLAGWSLETFVKGEPDQARATALLRLGNYANRGNRSRTHLHVVPPLVQAEEGADRWRVRVALSVADADSVATSPLNRKVRLHARNSETFAIIRVPGRPTLPAIRHAETAVRHAIAATRWQPVGGVTLRLHTLPSVLPFLSRFEVAVQVIERTHESATSDWERLAMFDNTGIHEAATQSTPRASIAD